MSFPEVVTGDSQPASNPTEFILSGEIAGLLEDAFVSSYGHVWSLTADPPPTVEQNDGQRQFNIQRKNGPFETTISGLTPGKTYYYAAYAIFEGQAPVYGAVHSFTTTPLMPLFSIEDLSVSPDKLNAIRIRTLISGLPPGLPVLSYGMTWGKDSLPDILSDEVVPEQGIIVSDPSLDFESELVLPAGTNFFRPYLLVGEQAYYGQTYPYLIDDTWSPLADYEGGPSAHAVGFSINGKGYIGAGTNFWEYDPKLDLWTQKADFDGGSRTSAVGFAIDSKGYIGTGYDTISRDDFWEYDPMLNTWKEKAAFGGGPRFDAVGFSIGSKGYIGTGRRTLPFTVPRNDFWEYDPATDTWAQKTDFGGVARYYAAGFSVGPMGYLGTGRDKDTLTLSDFWAFDPADPSLGQDQYGNPMGVWTRKADFAGGSRGYAVGLAIGSKGYLGLGIDETPFPPITADDFWEYDPDADSWTRRGDFSAGPRSDAVGFAIGKYGYVGMGNDRAFNPLNDFWEYFPEQ